MQGVKLSIDLMVTELLSLGSLKACSFKDSVHNSDWEKTDRYSTGGKWL